MLATLDSVGAVECDDLNQWVTPVGYLLPAGDYAKMRSEKPGVEEPIDMNLGIAARDETDSGRHPELDLLGGDARAA